MLASTDEKARQPQIQNKYRISCIRSQSIKINKLQKYKIIKLIRSGDYICNDKLGNNYLMVCHSQNGSKGVQEFFKKTKCQFHRNHLNRTLLTPFQDIEYHGLNFTIFMIPDNAKCIMDSSQDHFKSQIFCLSLLYSLVNKIVKPLTQIFGGQASKWIHEQNIWIKQNSVYYILSERKLKKHLKPQVFDSRISSQKATIIAQKQQQQKQLLHKLCDILIPYIKIDHELKSFQAMIIDSMINYQFGMNQIISILNDKQKRKKFINQRIQQNAQIDNVKEILKQNGEFWKKKNYHTGLSGRRGYKRYQNNNTQNLQLQKSRLYFQGQFSYHSNAPYRIKSKRSSLSPTRMFDFRRLQKKKRNSSVDQSKPQTHCQHQTVSMSTSKQFNQGLKYNDRYFKYNSTIQSLQMSIKQRAYKKFNQNVTYKNNYTHTINYQFNHQQQNKDNSIYLHGNVNKSLNNHQSQTIDVCQQIEKPSSPQQNNFDRKNKNQQRIVPLKKNYNVQEKISESKLNLQSKTDLKNISPAPTQQSKRQIPTVTTNNNAKNQENEPKVFIQPSTDINVPASNKNKNKNQYPVQQHPDLDSIQTISVQPSTHTTTIKKPTLSPPQQIKPNIQKTERKITESSIKTKKISAISKQVSQYVQMINKIGESVTKSGKIKQKLEGIQWFIGVYFIYKRFLLERKNMQRWLQKKQPNLTRHLQKDITQWNQWLNSQQKKLLQDKIKLQNQIILKSILSMNKKLLKKNLPQEIRKCASLQNHSQQQSKIAVQYVIKQYDTLVDNDKLQDEQIVLHINQLLNTLYIIAQLDGKNVQKKSLMEINKKLNLNQIQKYSQFIFQLYLGESIQ